ncbi:cation channel family protein (macronuclear) [Tetrahymena thermophila SB210]|uniref:Cation channel family protein n=1 Tax=Tetrahymena thermophila (strain SB210) TaxID=312017 RepID=I7M4I1_TETTS|nr:cation channel family protein [Tetrahymena thermophila SB210]EAS07090.2 cation channel family protein [Tetrahymena thermophila SB210]|eukprot:XP_001027332.2 cation channel family protein [Tetrahymena thermophila SB210]
MDTSNQQIQDNSNSQLNQNEQTLNGLVASSFAHKYSMRNQNSIGEYPQITLRQADSIKALKKNNSLMHQSIKLQNQAKPQHDQTQLNIKSNYLDVGTSDSHRVKSTSKSKFGDNRISYDFSNHNVELQNGKLVFKDIREDILTKKVDKALIKVQQINNQKYAIKLLGLKHFLLKLSRFTHSYMNKHLTKYQKTVIRDQALPEVSNNQIRDSSQKKDEDDLAFFERILQMIPLFNPSNTFILLWDVIQMIFILLFFFAIPLQIVYNLGIGTFITNILFNTGLVLFIIDNIICLNTTYFDKGIPVKDRQLIWYHYLRKHFVTDFLSNIPVMIESFLTSLSGIWGLLMLLQYLKVDRITIIIRKVEEIFHLSPKQKQLVRLAKLLFRVLFVAHIFSCIWLWLALTNNTDSQVWIDKYNYNTLSWDQQYLASYYFTTVTMITVGYGDFVPVNNREFAFCIFTMLVACGVFAYAVNQIGSIFENMSKQEMQINEMMYNISSYMHLKKVSKELQYQIREYLQYYWTEQQDRDTEIEEKIKSLLSDNLRDQLALEANNIVLKDSVVFINNFSNQVISRSVPLIKEYRATPDEIILIENTITEDQNIYFIEKGQVEVFLSQSDQPIQIMKLKAGDCFGQVGFFTGLTRTLSVKSLDFTTLIYIKRSEFIELLKEYPEDYEQFCYIKDKILNESDYRLIGMKCYSCKDGKHLANECPYLHYTPKKFLLLKKYFYPGYHQNRQKHERKKFLKSPNSLKAKSNIREKAEQIQEQFSVIIDELFGDEDFFDTDEEEENKLAADSDDEDDENSQENEEEKEENKDSQQRIGFKLPSFLQQLNYAKKLSIDRQVDKQDEGNLSESNLQLNNSNQKILPNQQINVQLGFLNSNSLQNQQGEDSEKLSPLGPQNEKVVVFSMETKNEEIDYENQNNEYNQKGYLHIQKDTNNIISSRKAVAPILKSLQSQSTTGTKEIKESQFSQNQIAPQQSVIIPTSNTKIEKRQSISKVQRQESKRKSTKKHTTGNSNSGGISNSTQCINAISNLIKKQNSMKDESTIYTNQLSSQYSKLETLSKQNNKYKSNNLAGMQKTNEFKNNNNILLQANSSVLENIKRISYDQNQLLLNKIIEILGSNTHTGRKTSQVSQSVIEGSDNQTNFYGLEDFDTLKNYSFYYPSSNVEYVLDKIVSLKNHTNVKHNLFIHLNKLKPTTQNNNQSNSINPQDFVRKNRKTGGTRIVASGGVAGNLLNKFRQQEDTKEIAQIYQESESNSIIGVNRSGSILNNGEGTPFVRGGARKATKRQNIMLVSGGEEGSDDSKKSNIEGILSQTQSKQSRFKNEVSKIQEEEDEEERERQRLSMNISDINQQATSIVSEQVKLNFKYNQLEDCQSNRTYELDAIFGFKGETFSKIPSQQSISDNGQITGFRNLECSPSHHKNKPKNQKIQN